MSNYLFIQSQDPFTEVRSVDQFNLAIQLANAGHNVQMLLVQNGVCGARKGANCPAFDQLASKVSLFADDFSMAQREIDRSQLKHSITPAGVDIVIDAMLAGNKVIWN